MDSCESGGIIGALKIFPVAPNRIQPSGPCAKLILDAEIECGAFISATNQLFGKVVAPTAVGPWVEELEAGRKHFQGPVRMRIVTIFASSRLADRMSQPVRRKRLIMEEASGSAFAKSKRKTSAMSARRNRPLSRARVEE
jgi:hypothetical protein